MQSLLSLIEKSSVFLESKGVAQARLDAEWLFAHALNCQRLDLYLQHDRPITPAEADAIRPLVVRRGQREPLQYITGKTAFYGLDLVCDARALIPRPETEELVELLTGLDLKPQAVLDLGTGTGCLGLALASHYNEARVCLVDASESSLALATENAAQTAMGARVELLASDWFSALGGQRFDLIASNPPYLTEAEWAAATPEVRQFEPREALVGGDPEGAGALLHILREAPAYLKPGGCLAMETGIGQHPLLSQAAPSAGYQDWQSIQDLSHRPRFFVARMA